MPRLHSRQQPRGGYILFFLLCFSFAKCVREALEDAFRPGRDVSCLSRARQAQLRPCHRRHSGREALLVLALVLSLRRVLLGSRACEAASRMLDGPFDDREAGGALLCLIGEI